MIDYNKIRELRTASGAGLLDCKHALEAKDNNVKEAVDWLKKNGKLNPKNRGDKPMSAGRCNGYIHPNGSVAVIVDVGCETDFVANTDEFKEFCHDIAMHIAAMNPSYLTADEIPYDIRQEIHDELLRSFRNLEPNKAEHIVAMVVSGKFQKWVEEVALMQQKFVKDNTKRIGDVLGELSVKVGERCEIRRFQRFALNDGNKS